jgi:hypothetical protein
MQALGAGARLRLPCEVPALRAEAASPGRRPLVHSAHLLPEPQSRWRLVDSAISTLAVTLHLLLHPTRRRLPLSAAVPRCACIECCECCSAAIGPCDGASTSHKPSGGCGSLLTTCPRIPTLLSPSSGVGTTVTASVISCCRLTANAADMMGSTLKLDRREQLIEPWCGEAPLDLPEPNLPIHRGQ